MSIILKEVSLLQEEVKQELIARGSIRRTSTPGALRWVKSLGIRFHLCVTLPVLVSVLYYGIIASDVYVSEASFVVRSPDKSSSSSLGFLLKSAGFSNSGDSAFAAEDYVKSRDALRAINADQLVAKAYTRPHVSFLERFDPFGSRNSFEDLFDYYNDRVLVAQDSATGITKLTVKAYRPEDAFAINQRLLLKAEAVINQLNDRGREDMINLAKIEVDGAKKRATNAALALAAYRNNSGVVDPEQQAQAQLQMVSKLQDTLIATNNQLFQLRAFVPGNAQIPVLEAKAKSLSSDIARETGRLAGNNHSLAASAVEYQRLSLEDQFAQKELTTAMASLADSQNEARRKQAYVETIVVPNKPDKALEPRRLRGMLTTLILGLVAWAIFGMLLSGIREHQD